MERAVRQCGCAACRSGETQPEQVLHRQLNEVLNRLDERERRWTAALEARRRGWHGVREVAQITGMDVKTIYRGLGELDRGVANQPADRIRQAGGGRPAIEVRQPGITAALKTLVEPETAGDPQSEQRWVRSTLRSLRDRLRAAGYTISHESVGALLRGMGYSLRVNVKEKTSASHPDRNLQFEHIQAQIGAHQRAGQPVISVDTKKKS